MSKEQTSNIMEVFGKFAVELEDGPTMFDTLEAAQEAEVLFQKGAEVRDEALAYCAYKGIDGKNAKGKTNVITDYLTWVAIGKPEAEAKEVVEAKEDAAADEVSTAVDPSSFEEAGAEDDQEADTEF